MNALNIHDIQNLLKLLARSTFNGLDEAEVAVVLKHKLVAYGDVTINGVPMPPFTIGRGTDFEVETKGDSLVAFIWER